MNIHEIYQKSTFSHRRNLPVNKIALAPPANRVEESFKGYIYRYDSRGAIVHVRDSDVKFCVQKRFAHAQGARRVAMIGSKFTCRVRLFYYERDGREAEREGE